LFCRRCNPGGVGRRPDNDAYHESGRLDDFRHLDAGPSHAANDGSGGESDANPAADDTAGA
jgi:hypothetical protein